MALRIFIFGDSIAGIPRSAPRRSAWRSFYLRAVCRILQSLGRRGFPEEITIRHSKYAASRFAREAAPALLNSANSSPNPFINGIRAAREQIVARHDGYRTDFLRRRRFFKADELP